METDWGDGGKLRVVRSIGSLGDEALTFPPKMNSEQIAEQKSQRDCPLAR